MQSVSLLIFVVLLCIIHPKLINAQKKAQQKCKEYKQSQISVKLSKLLVHHIIGGTSSKNNEFPHMVALGFGPNNNLKWLCGGTLVSENFVVTAAHCTSNIELGNAKVVRLGTTSLNDGKALNIEVATVIKHPSYKPPSHYNDIALVRLKSKVNFSASISPACLNTISNIKPKNNELIATGWGRLSFAGVPSDNLMKVHLNLYSKQECNVKYSSVSKRKLAKGIVDSQVCAGGRNNEEKDTCQGDSGGPLVLKSENIFSIIGVTSFGKACGISNTPGVYTRVSAFIPWIERIVWP